MISRCPITAELTVIATAAAATPTAIAVADARAARLAGVGTRQQYPLYVDNFQEGAQPLPPEFAAVIEQLRDTNMRDELRIREIPAPGGIAPYAFAVAADIGNAPEGRDSEHGTGRFILMHDPEQPEAWNGSYRIVSFAQAPQDPEIASDPFLAQVTWSWLEDALEKRGAEYHSPSGTATKIISAGFGELSSTREGAQIELRASWTPTGSIGLHLAAWSDVLCALAGLSIDEGAVPMDKFARGEL